MAIQLIAFDFDGTLADSLPCFVAALNEAAALHGFRPVTPDLFAELRGLGSRQLMKRLDIPLWKVPAVTLEMRRQMQRRIAEVRLFAGLEAAVTALAARGVPLAVATSNSWANVEAVLGPRLGACIGQYRCDIAVFGKQRALRALAAEKGIAPHELLYVGDEIRDAQAATTAGAAFQGVSWGYAHADALRAHCTRPLLEAPADLARLP